jgi:hypothetical protein
VEEMVLQDMTDKLIGVGGHCRMKMNVEKKQGNEKLKNTIPYRL